MSRCSVPLSASARRHCRIRNDSSLPHRFEKIGFADNPVTLPYEINEQVKHLGLKLDQLAVAPELAAIDIEPAVSEGNNHSRSPRSLRHTVSGWNDSVILTKKQGSGKVIRSVRQ
ncbi:MAG: hypothetical protein WB783_03690 [Arenicellales bacterium]